MPFAHLYVCADQRTVLDGMDRYLRAAGFVKIEMRPELHPRRVKQTGETKMRLYWVSPRLGDWTGVFEFRYYTNETRHRWGLADEQLGLWLSRELAVPVYRLEVVDNARFWLWNRFEAGAEKEGGAYEAAPGDASADPQHPRYAMNRIIEREGLRNVGLSYENIPGPPVCAVETIPQSPKGIEGLEGFVHLAYGRQP